MSYSAKGQGPMRILKESFPDLLEEIGYGVEEGKTVTKEQVKDAFENEGFTPFFDDEGNIKKLLFTYNVLMYAEEFLEKIAPWVEDGSSMDFEGEDGDCWEWEFTDGEMSGGPDGGW